MGAKKERERVGPLIVTTSENVEPGRIVCAMCAEELARVKADGTLEPTPDQLLAAGRVPVPNFGWFSNQKCARDYEQTFHVAFRRDGKGEVSYYEK